MLLFVRKQRRQGRVTEPLVSLDFARYESNEGERPMPIRWRLRKAIPGAFYPELAVAV